MDQDIFAAQCLMAMSQTQHPVPPLLPKGGPAPTNNNNNSNGPRPLDLSVRGSGNSNNNNNNPPSGNSKVGTST